jgi:hypothetical protein
MTTAARLLVAEPTLATSLRKHRALMIHNQSSFVIPPKSHYGMGVFAFSVVSGTTSVIVCAGNKLPPIVKGPVGNGSPADLFSCPSSRRWRQKIMSASKIPLNWSPLAARLLLITTRPFVMLLIITSKTGNVKVVAPTMDAILQTESSHDLPFAVLLQ